MNFAFDVLTPDNNQTNKLSRKKPIFPVNDLLRNYLQLHGREVILPVSYGDLLHVAYAVPLKDKNGKDSLWKPFHMTCNTGNIFGLDW